MNIWEVDKLVLFLVFFIPGFISIKIYDLLVPRQRKDISKLLIEAIGYSSFNFALLSWVVVIIHTGNFYDAHRVWYLLSLIFILFVMPAAWPFVFLHVASLDPIARRISHPVQKPWDWVFRKREAYWTIIHLKDGRRIGGRYDTQSFASSYPEKEQIYLEEVWKLDEDGKFIEPVERTEGIIVLGEEISSIEFFGD